MYNLIINLRNKNMIIYTLMEKETLQVCFGKCRKYRHKKEGNIVFLRDLLVNYLM